MNENYSDINNSLFHILINESQQKILNCKKQEYSISKYKIKCILSLLSYTYLRYSILHKISILQYEGINNIIKNIIPNL